MEHYGSSRTFKGGEKETNKSHRIKLRKVESSGSSNVRCIEATTSRCIEANTYTVRSGFNTSTKTTTKLQHKFDCIVVLVDVLKPLRTVYVCT
jgi:hypothetical protein